MAAKKNAKKTNGARGKRTATVGRTTAVGAVEKFDPNKTLIIISDTGIPYVITNDKWSQQQLSDAGAEGVVKSLTSFGSYLSNLPPGTPTGLPGAAPVAVGFGELCTVVNLKAVLENLGKP